MPLSPHSAYSADGSFHKGEDGQDAEGASSSMTTIAANGNNNNFYAPSVLQRKRLLANTQEINIITSMDDLYQLNITTPSASSSSTPANVESSGTVAAATTGSKDATVPSYFNSDDFGLLLQGEEADAECSNSTGKVESGLEGNNVYIKEEEGIGAEGTENYSFNDNAESSDHGYNDSIEANCIAFCDGNGSIDFENMRMNSSYDDIVNEDVLGTFSNCNESIYFGGGDLMLLDNPTNVKGLDGEQNNAQNNHRQQLFVQYVLRHPLLPHFQRVIVYLKKNGFLANIGDEDIRIQQQLMQGNHRGISVERFLQAYDVTLPQSPPEGTDGDDEMMRKIYQLKKAYDEELVNMDNACHAFVNRMRMLQFEHSKVVPVSEQQILAKAFLIQGKFAYLRKQLKANICNAMLTVLAPKLKSRTHTPLSLSKPSSPATPPLVSTPPPPLQPDTPITTTIKKHNLNTLSSSCDTYAFANVKEEEKSEEGEEDSENYGSADDAEAAVAKARNSEDRLKVTGNISRGKLKMRDMRKKKKKALSRTATEVLSKWFNDHIKDPYPSENEKKTMAATLGLHINQVNNWFGNKRIRHKRRIQEMAEIQQRQMQLKR
jgi:hypothetical protein